MAVITANRSEKYLLSTIFLSSKRKSVTSGTSTLALDAGAPDGDAEARARIAYVAWLGFYIGIAPTMAEQRIADMDQLYRMMLSP